MTCLAKHEFPQSGADFRPITVLGILYRCWGTFHARHSIKHLEGLLPEHLYGSRPGRHAAQLWSRLLWSIEHAYLHDIKLTGLVADLQKAFNCISREIVFDVLAWIGIPQGVLCAWAGAVSQMGRRFQVRGSLSPRVLSSTGFAEGDALSCIAMVAIDLLFHAWHTHFFPLCSPLSFVDDWQLLTCNPDEALLLLECLKAFVAEIDMDLDLCKTFAWSVCSSTRALLKKNGIRVALGARNLGAHMQLSRRHTNHVQMDRVSKLGHLWTRMRLSAGSYLQKLRAIRAVAWPKGLHAIASTTLSHATFNTLRSGALKALQADGAGVNSHLHFLIHLPQYDPLFWTLIQTFRIAQACGDPCEVTRQMYGFTHHIFDLPDSSITATLVTRIQHLGWNVTPEGHLCDLWGPFDLFRICAQELNFRAEAAWHLCVCQEVNHRKGLHDLHLTLPSATRKWFDALDLCNQGLARKILNGAHFTNDGLQFCHESLTDLCPWCESSDSRYHRFWQCPQFQFARDTLPAGVMEVIPWLPESLTCFGWALKPSTWRMWFSALACLPEHPVSSIVSENEVVHLFTDGSCFDQQNELSRFASWSVVIAGCEGDFSASHVHAAGPLPGLLQNAYRAETYAVRHALLASTCLSGRLMIWTDCAAVVRRLDKLLQGVFTYPELASW